MKLRIALVVLTLVGAARPAAAQMVDLTEADALARLAPHAITLRQVAAGLPAADAARGAALPVPNPQLLFGRTPVLDSSERFFAVSELLPVTGTRFLDARAAARRADAARLRSDGLQRQARADLRLAFAALVAAQKRVEALELAATKMRALVKIVATREEAGDTAGFDRLRAESEVTDLEARLTDEREAQARAQAGLARLLTGDPDPRTIHAVAATDAPAPAPLPADTALVAAALKDRPELRAMEQELEAARFARRAATLSFIPEPALTLGVASSPVDTRKSGLFALGFTVPLSGAPAAQRARAAGEEQERLAAVEAARAETRTSVLALAAIVADRRKAVDRVRTTSVTSAAVLERVASASYDNGLRSVIELVDAYRTGVAARTRLADLELDLRRTELELEDLTGGSLP